MENQWLTIEKIGQKEVLTKCSKEAEGEIRIRVGVEVIQNEAFWNCNRVTSVIIPESVKNIGNGAFANCTGISSIMIPKSVKHIDNNAFIGCNNLKKVYLPNLIERIGEYAFWCQNLETITIIDPINSNSGIPQDTNGVIDEAAFYGCPNLKVLSIPASIKTINKHSFDEDGHTYDEVRFEGDIPETNNAFEHCNIKKLKINKLKKNAYIPQELINCIEGQRHDHIFYAAPELCKEPSQVPGYIKTTLIKNDELVDINTKYIVSVESITIERYHTMEGSLITCASNGMDRSCQISVYEPCDMVLKKIEDSLSTLSQQVGGIAGLLNQIETLNKEPIYICKEPINH